jgi:dTDP-4-dehydrorhamnose 3,5-epimerase
MKALTTSIPGLLVLRLPRREDERGFFAETYRRSWMEENGLPTGWAQDNHSLSRLRGTVRGLHFQVPPRAQAKLVRVVAGRIFDAVVDLRRNSPAYGRHAAFEMGAGDDDQLLVPAGLAHGFCTLEDDTEVLYKVSDYYSPEHDRGLRWDDPALRIPWPVAAADAVLSARDRQHPLLADLPDYFPEEA